MTIKPRKLKEAAPSRPSPSPTRQMTIPFPASIAPVHVFGGYAETVNVIPRTHASLHLAPGRLEKADGDDGNPRKVLLPFAEILLGGSALIERDHRSDGNQPDDGNEEGDGMPTVFSANVPLENLAFILLDLATDLGTMCQEVTSLGDGELAVDRARMGYVRYYLAHLERQARRARIRLDRHYGEPEAGTENP